MFRMKGKFPNGLKQAMDRADIGPTELAAKAKTSKQNIDRWAKGERELGAGWSIKLAPLLGVTAEELIFVDYKASAKRVPLLTWVSAGKLAAVDGIHNVDAKKTITVGDLPKGDWIALEVKGDSMDWIAPDGAIILVNCKDERLKDDLFYVFATPDGEATFKRYRSDVNGGGGRLQPYSRNPDHETQRITDGMKVVGRVRRVITDI
jgi:SOS-response transcriptional repressor LexA